MFRIRRITKSVFNIKYFEERKIIIRIVDLTSYGSRAFKKASEIESYIQTRVFGKEIYDVENYIGNAVVVNCTKLKNNCLNVSDLDSSIFSISKGSGILIKTGCEEKVYPSIIDLSENAILWIIKKSIKFIGIDAILPMQKKYDILSNMKIPIIEGLSHFDLLKSLELFFVGTPLPLEGELYHPVRAVGIVNELLYT